MPPSAAFAPLSRARTRTFVPRRSGTASMHTICQWPGKLNLSIPILQGGSPVVYRGQVGQGYAGRMEIKVDGALPGYIYRIMVQEMNPVTSNIMFY